MGGVKEKEQMFHVGGQADLWKCFLGQGSMGLIIWGGCEEKPVHVNSQVVFILAPGGKFVHIAAPRSKKTNPVRCPDPKVGVCGGGGNVKRK